MVNTVEFRMYESNNDVTSQPHSQGLPEDADDLICLSMLEAQQIKHSEHSYFFVVLSHYP